MKQTRHKDRKSYRKWNLQGRIMTDDMMILDLRRNISNCPFNVGLTPKRRHRSQTKKGW